MLLAKDGNQTNLVKDILPDKFANMLIGKDNKGGSMVATYAKVMDDHMFKHYETYVKTRISEGDQGQLNVMDLLYYHTYGDYRMVLDNNQIKFQYLRTDQPLGATSHLKENFTSPPFLGVAGVPGLYGIYNRQTIEESDRTRTDFGLRSSGEISWLDDELNQGSAGSRLMLPSIGTLFVTTYGYTNINKEFRKMLQALLREIASGLDKYLPDLDYVDYLTKIITPHLGSFNKTPENFTRELTAAYNEDPADAYLYIVNTLIEEQVARFERGERVIIKEGASVSNVIANELSALIGENFDIEDYVYIVRDSRIVDKKYEYDIEPDQIEGVVTVPQSILASTTEPSRAMTQKKGKYFAIPEAQQLVAYSEIIDHIFTLHSYIYLCQNLNFNTGYISSGVNKSKKPAQIQKDFPNMYSPTGSRDELNDFAKGKPSDKNCFIRNLLQLRNAYTQMILKAQRSAATDARVFDEFYKGDLTLKEVKWLAFMLSEGAKIITRQPEKINALQQLTYVRPGADEGVDLYGEANRRTIFYNVDIPLLKDVMLEYVYAFNEITVKSAYSLESKSGNEGAIAKALWGSIKKRTGKLFENTEVIPFRFFNQLFNGVNQVINQGELISFDPYPPNWSDTNILSYLTVDPNQLNTFLSAEEYTLRLSEYLDYLYVRYGNRPRIAAAILTAIEGYRISESTAYEKIRAEFIDMVETHNKKSQLKGTDITFTAYLLVLSIMRAELEVPLTHREDYIAEGYEREQLRQILDERNYADRLGVAAAPPGHPLYREPPVAPPEPPVETEEPPVETEEPQASPVPRPRVRAPYPDNIETPDLTEVEVINLLQDNGGEITFMAIVQDVIELSREELEEYLAEEAA